MSYFPVSGGAWTGGGAIIDMTPDDGDPRDSRDMVDDETRDWMRDSRDMVDDETRDWMRDSRDMTPDREGGSRDHRPRSGYPKPANRLQSRAERDASMQACRSAGVPEEYVQACSWSVARTGAPAAAVAKALSFGINPSRDPDGWRARLKEAEELAASEGSIFGIPRNAAIFGGVAGAGALLWFLIG